MIITNSVHNNPVLLLCNSNSGNVKTSLHYTSAPLYTTASFLSKYDMRKFYFTNSHWNSLPNWVVSTNNINAFKKDLTSIGNSKIS